jgi:hypothetical protein
VVWWNFVGECYRNVILPFDEADRPARSGSLAGIRTLKVRCVTNLLFLLWQLSDSLLWGMIALEVTSA